MTYAAENVRFVRQLELPADVFDRPRVLVSLPRSQEHRVEAALSFALTANLMVRMFRRVQLVAPDLPLGPNPWGLESLHALKPMLSELSEGEVVWGNVEADIAIGVGAPAEARAGRTAFTAFSGFEASLDLALGGELPGPFGALFAGCYGAAQAFLHASSLAGGARPLIRPFRLSLLDYAPSGTNAFTPTHVELGTSHLVGVGAVGSALIYALAHLPSLKGNFHLIDNDVVDGTNLNRYVLMRRTDVGKAKPEVAANALSRTGLTPLPFPDSFERFAQTHREPVELLLTPVDSEAGRRKLASYLPRSVLNAATGNSTVTLSRHGFGDGKACLSCLYLPKGVQLSTEGRLAVDMGLGEKEVYDLLAGNTPVGRDVVNRVERYRGLPHGSLEPFVGQHIQSFYQRAVCGTAPVSTAAGTVVAPLFFHFRDRGRSPCRRASKGEGPIAARVPP
jgi:hypothetical protein